MRDHKRATMLVAFYQPDVLDGRAYPTLVGCIDADTLEIIDLEDQDRLFREMSERMLGPSAVDYELRKVDVLLPVADLQKLIEVHTIVATVDSDALRNKDASS